MERIAEKERQYVLEVLEGQFRNSTSGIMSKRLEQAFCDKFGARYAIAHVNGTATMHAALAAAGIGPGDEVIVPPLTMASTAFAVLHANAVPVFADVDPDTFLIDPNAIRRVITGRTRAIITVALYGLSPDMDEIMKIAQAHDLVVIEDDAQCFLGFYRGKVVGSLGHMSSFSFQSSKHMTCGEGGIVLTNDRRLADNVRRFNSLGYAGVSAGTGRITRDDIQNPNYERHVSLGFNYRMSELCAAVALAQVERLEELVDKRAQAARLYAEAVKGCNWLKPQRVPEDCEHSYWTFVLKLEDGLSFTWEDFRRKYAELGGDGIYAAWKVNYLEPVFKNRAFFPGGCPVTCPYASDHVQQYVSGLCPIAESLQPRLLQFKTNFTSTEKAERQAEALAKTIHAFEAGI